MVIVFFLPIPVSHTTSVTIRAPFEKVLAQVSSLERWKRWWPEPSGVQVIGDTNFHTPRTEYRIDRKQSLGLVLTQDNKSVYHLLTVTPGAGDSSCTLDWKEIAYLRTAVTARIKSFFNRGDNYTPAALTQHIRESTEVPLKYYGFRITIEPVEDTLVLVQQIYCTKENVNRSIEQIYTTVQQYLDALHYTGRAERMFFVDSVRSDSVRVMAGFSITKRIPLKAPFQMMTMPKAHIVTGEYEGDYRNIGSIHAAMNEYMKDHNITPVAVVYEKLLTQPRTREDSMHVKARVYYPSFIP